jgi:ribose transport system substrate-binding protein
MTRKQEGEGMTITRRAVAAAAIAAILPLAAAAGASAGEAQPRKVERIAFFGFAKANSFANATWAGVQDAAKARGAEATFFDPNFDAQKQVSQIQDAITSGDYQAFVIQANDGNAVVPVVRQAIRAGITVVGEFTPIGTRYDTIAPQVPGLLFVGEAPTWNGDALGRLGVQACRGRNPCRVAYLEGFKALPLDNARTRAVKRALSRAKNVQIVASVEGGYTAASGLKAAQDVLTANPDVNVMIGSAQAIQGAEQAVRTARKQGRVKLIGNGGSCQAVAAVRGGRWFATYVIAERSSGRKATQVAIQAAEGKKVAASFDTRKLQNPLGTKPGLKGYKAQYCD